MPGILTLKCGGFSSPRDYSCREYMYNAIPWSRDFTISAQAYEFNAEHFQKLLDTFNQNVEGQLTYTHNPVSSFGRSNTMTEISLHFPKAMKNARLIYWWATAFLRCYAYGDPPITCESILSVFRHAEFYSSAWGSQATKLVTCDAWEHFLANKEKWLKECDSGDAPISDGVATVYYEYFLGNKDVYYEDPRYTS